MKIYPPVGGGSATTDASLLTSGTLPLARLSGITTTELDAAAGIVSGQIAELSLSKLTAGTLIPSLVLDYGSGAGTGTVTAGSTQILNTSAGLALNVQTGKTLVLGVNNTAILTTAAASVSTAVPFLWTTDLSPGGTVYTVAKFSSTIIGIGAPTGGTINDVINGTSVWSCGGALASTTIPISWSTNVALTSSAYTIGKHTTTQLAVNSASGGSFAVRINGAGVSTWTNVIQDNAVPISWNASVALTASTYAIGRHASTSMAVNVPTGGSILFSVNNIAAVTVSSANLTLADAVDIVTNATTGTKFMTAASQKGGFWGATPIVQPAGANQAAITDSTGGTAGFTLSDVTITPTQTLINNNFASLNRQVDAIRTALVNAGIIKGAA